MRGLFSLMIFCPMILGAQASKILPGKMVEHVSWVKNFCSLYYGQFKKAPESVGQLRKYLHQVGVQSEAADVDSVLDSFRSITFVQVDSTCYEINFDAYPFCQDSINVDIYNGKMRIFPGAENTIIYVRTNLFRGYDRRTKRMLEFKESQ